MPPNMPENIGYPNPVHAKPYNQPIKSKLKLCEKCNENKDPGEFEVIICGAELGCVVCSACRSKNKSQCVKCNRFYSDYENEILSFI